MKRIKSRVGASRGERTSEQKNTKQKNCEKRGVWWPRLYDYEYDGYVCIFHNDNEMLLL